MFKIFAASSEDYQSKPSLSKVQQLRQPISNLIETDTYHELRKIVEHRCTLILRCHGVPGSGKSQIVRKLAKYFPFDSENDQTSQLHIKWHIQCKDSEHRLKEQLKKLSESLVKHGFIAFDKCQALQDRLDSDVAGELVDILSNTNVPVLIIIEDPDEKWDAALLSDLFRCLHSIVDGTKSKFHVYITSRTKCPLLPEEEAENMKIYKSKDVHGFSEEESKNFLGAGSDLQAQKAAINIHRRFGGLPLGLQAAKSYCRKAKMSYTKYLQRVNDNEYQYKVLEIEQKAISREYGNLAKHVFQAVVMPFLPSKNPSENELLHWKILLCLSYFHYDRIPRFALEQCCHLLRNRRVKNPKLENEDEVATLVSTLVDYGMCTETDQKEITFHEVVQISFRLNQHKVLHNSTFDPVKETVEIMCSLVSKDMRKKDHSTKMRQLRRHVQALLDLIDRESLFEINKELGLHKALISHLYDTTGAVMLFESPEHREESEKYFHKALNYIWEDVETLIDPKEESSIHNLAMDVVNFSIESGSSLEPGFTLNYSAKLELCLDESDLKFLESQSNQGCFREVKKSLRCLDSNKTVLEKLQKCHLFLDDDKYRPIFYAERVASILHSWSRSITYADSSAASEDKKCKWMSLLSHAVCMECRKSCDVPLLIEHLSITGGLVPIVLKQKKGMDSLREILDDCTRELSSEKETRVMYENGLLKEIFGPSKNATKMKLLRFIVRIYGRLIAMSSKHSIQQDISHGDKQCEDLIELAKCNASNINSSMPCMVYCAKYYAAKKDFTRSLECYNEVFEMVKHEKPRISVYCWVLYNYARTALCSGNSDAKRDAKNKCDEQLRKNPVLTRSLNDHLTSTLKELLK